MIKALDLSDSLFSPGLHTIWKKLSIKWITSLVSSLSHNFDFVSFVFRACARLLVVHFNVSWNSAFFSLLTKVSKPVHATLSLHRLSGLPLNQIFWFKFLPHLNQIFPGFDISCFSPLFEKFLGLRVSCKQCPLSFHVLPCDDIRTHIFFHFQIFEIKFVNNVTGIRNCTSWFNCSCLFASEICLFSVRSEFFRWIFSNFQFLVHRLKHVFWLVCWLKIWFVFSAGPKLEFKLKSSVG